MVGNLLVLHAAEAVIISEVSCSWLSPKDADEANHSLSIEMGGRLICVL